MSINVIAVLGKLLLRHNYSINFFVFVFVNVTYLLTQYNNLSEKVYKLNDNKHQSRVSGSQLLSRKKKKIEFPTKRNDPSNFANLTTRPCLFILNFSTLKLYLQRVSSFNCGIAINLSSPRTTIRTREGYDWH